MLNNLLQWLTGLAIIGIFVVMLMSAVYYYPVVNNYLMLDCLKKYTKKECIELLK